MAFVFNYIQMRRSPVNSSIIYEDTKNISEEIIVEDDFYCNIYSIVLPIICIFGVFGNIVSFLVLFKIKIRCSSYTYLTVRTASDLIVCVLLLFSIVAHGSFFNFDGDDFDLLVILPLASIFSGISVCATVGVTLDRLLVVRNLSKPTKPTVCTPPVARRIMAGSIFASVLANMPYFFIFTIHDNGLLYTTNFFISRLYVYYNWIRFAIYDLLPSVIILLVTGLLIISIQRVSNQLLHLSCKSKAACSVDPTRMTMTLIAIAIFFLIGELPGQILSKKSAFIFFYSGDVNTVVTDDDGLGIFRQVALILGALNNSINFFILYMLHPPFGKGLKELFSKEKKHENKQQLLVNVYVIAQESFDVKKIELPKFYQLNTWVSQ